MTLKDQIINELGELSDENLIAVLSFIRYLKEGLVEHEQQKPSRKKVGYFSDKKYIADGFDFDEDNELIAEELGKTVEQVTELIEALKRDSIAKLVEDLKKAEERADKEGWLTAEEVRRSVE